MPQDPFKVDALQIEPGSGQTLLIQRDAATGALKFTDNVLGGGILLAQLAGLRSIGNVFVVGTSGAGAEYTTIQAALDAVPANAGPTNPYLILVMPGVYTETVNIVRDGVAIVGIGSPRIQSALEATPNAVGNDHTVIISAQLGTIPRRCLIQGFEISNAHDNRAALRIVGGAASEVGNDALGLQVVDCILRAVSPGGNRPLWATAVNRVEVRGGAMLGSAGAILLGEEVSTCVLRRVNIESNVSLRYDTAQDQPVNGDDRYELANCPNVGSQAALAPVVSFTGQGGGALGVFESSIATGRVSIIGDRTAEFRNSTLGELDIQNTSTVNLYNSKKASLLAANANAVLNEPRTEGTAAFAASANVVVTFPVPMTDNGFDVLWELDARPANDETPWITAKAGTGFTINFQTNQTLNMRWVAVRRDR